jgi:hypothetical protein
LWCYLSAALALHKIKRLSSILKRSALLVDGMDKKGMMDPAVMMGDIQTIIEDYRSNFSFSKFFNSFQAKMKEDHLSVYACYSTWLPWEVTFALTD